MDEFLIYIFQVSVCHSIFYLTYVALFKKHNFFAENRFFLLSSVVVGFIIPAIEIQVWEKGVFYGTIANPVNHLSYTNTSNASSSMLSGSLQYDFISIFELICLVVYSIGVLYYLIKFLIGLWKIFRIIHLHNATDNGSFKLIYLQNGPSFYSFLNYIFINVNQISISEEELQQVIEHEKSHVQQRHTLDVFFIEIVCMICWFNPLIHQINYALRQTHEYIADESVTTQTATIDQYSRLLLKLASSNQPFTFTHQFSMMHIKNRIIMLNKSKINKMKTIRFFMALPVFVLLMAIFSFTEKTEVKNTNYAVTIKSENELQIGTITWEGNTIFSDAMLTRMLGVQSGDNYSKEIIDQRLMYHANGDDISSVYMDNGHMYLSIVPVEEINGNIVNLHFKIYEGETATIDKIIISGNKKVATSKVLDLIDFKSGELFSRSKLIQSQKNIAESGLFKSDEVGINPIPHEDNPSLVDIEFVLLEL